MQMGEDSIYGDAVHITPDMSRHLIGSYPFVLMEKLKNPTAMLSWLNGA